MPIQIPEITSAEESTANPRTFSETRTSRRVAVLYDRIYSYIVTQQPDEWFSATSMIARRQSTHLYQIRKCISTLEGNPTPFAACDELFESHYQRLVDSSGPWCVADGRLQELAFWREWGDEAISWLIDRLRQPTNVDAASIVAGVLASLAPGSIVPILRKLNADEPRVEFEQAYALLLALAWLGPLNDVDPNVASARRAIRRFLADPDAALREQAVSALSVLPTRIAIEMASSALSNEADPDVRETIADKFAELRDR